MGTDGFAGNSGLKRQTISTVPLRCCWLMFLLAGLILPSCRSSRGDKEHLTFQQIDQTYAVETVVVLLSQTVPVPTETAVEPTPSFTFLPAAQTLTTPLTAGRRTITVTPTKTPPPCDLAAFVLDVTVPDGTRFYAGNQFTKTWRLKNTGTCTWTSEYALVFLEGDRLSASASVLLPGEVKPLQEVDISVPMTAPNELGRYRGSWTLRNASGKQFGLADGSPVYVEIEVIAPQASAVVYEFAKNACNAAWSSSASGLTPLSCPGERSDEKGYLVIWENNRLEDGSYPGQKILETHPTWSTHVLWDDDQNGGWIQGVYPAVTIQPGSHLKTNLGCLYGTSTCDVNFVIEYRIAGYPWQELAAWEHAYNGSLIDVDINLVNFVGLNVEFLFYVDANNNGGQDQAVWVYPRIEK